MQKSRGPALPTAVSIRGVSKRLGGNLVLDNVSLDLPRGQTTAVLGESGCGKTTLLHHVNGLLRPDQGVVEIFGAALDYERLPELRRRMGYAVQAVGLFPHLTMRGNLALVPRLDGWSDERVDARARQLMQTLHLNADLLDRYPHQLSGGQRQRFGICRAMMLQPDLLLFDEPFSGVDPITRIRIHTELLALLRAEPATTLLVTHDVREAIRLSTYLVVMAHGRIVQHGSVDDVLASPADDDVARLFSEQLRDPVTGVTR